MPAFWQGAVLGAWSFSTLPKFPSALPWVREGGPRHPKAAAVSISAAGGREYSLRTGVGSWWGWGPLNPG